MILVSRFGSAPLLLLLLIVFEASSADDDLAPDRNSQMADQLFRNQAYSACRSADLFPRDGTDYDLPDVISEQPVAIRAINSYDMDLDPVGAGYDQDTCSGFDTGQKLTRPGDGFHLDGTLGPVNDLEVSALDAVLFITRAAIFDDSENNFAGDLQANFKLDVFPVTYQVSSGTFFTGRCGSFDVPLLNHLPWYGVPPGFKTKLRGPFWTGEKFEVGDTDFLDTGLLPQVMHYENLGIWNWAWCPEASAVVVRVWEGDGGFGDDDVAFIIVQKEETESDTITISDTGDVVELSLTADARLHRRVVDASGLDSIRSWPRVSSNPDVHNIDLTFRTESFAQSNSQSRGTFPGRYGFAGNQIRGWNTAEDTCLVSCSTHIDFTPVDTICTDGSSLSYIDNVSSINGWDCSFLSNNLPDLVSFDLTDSQNASVSQLGTDIVPGCGFCGDKVSVFFRGSILSLPRGVLVNQQGPIEISGDTSIVVELPRTPGYDGVAFSELLARRDFDNVDLGFRITKSEMASSFLFDVATLYGGGGSVALRFTSIEWPTDLIAADINRATLSTAGAGEDGFRITDVPLPALDAPFFVVHEVLAYDTSSDDDMGWLASHEVSEDRVSFSLAQAAGNENAHLESEGFVIQFRDIGAPVVSCPVPITVECNRHGGVLRSDPLLANFFSSTSASDNCDDDDLPVDSDAPDIFGLGDTSVTFCATDSSGNRGCCSSTVRVQDTQPPDIDVRVTPTILWPPSHKLKSVVATVDVSDICDPAPFFQLISIASSEPEDDRGDGHTVDDIQGASLGTADTEFSLRAERSGRRSGRDYGILYRGFDGSGNSSNAVASVRVPHDQAAAHGEQRH